MSDHIAAMLDVHPQAAEISEKSKLAECIAACHQCAQTCTSCADACLAEDMVSDLVSCLRSDLDCADVCAATGIILMRQTASNPGVGRAMLEACRAACSACAEECERHAGMHEHCRICAAACRRCEQACAALLAASG
ncbi:hypothetical protein J2W14_000341 [Pseudarthrobacter oxydans]|uniref:four-helix bundle copper-binding protein n=1 Tax=Pseudarthrobacter oxydans TaxID=1671 RepID=UPI00277E6F6B|nr:four-helix bundle copper-binding protein [Pseudarthrobacter oxydans]MDP9980965.1 hypothetical protein [Pseudarthrobacter oxydans]